MSCVQARDKHSVTALEVTRDRNSPQSGVRDVMCIQSNKSGKVPGPSQLPGLLSWQYTDDLGWLSSSARYDAASSDELWAGRLKSILHQPLEVIREQN